MTDVEFVELRKIAENATPGPWEVATMKASSEFGDYDAHGIKGVAPPVWYSDSDMAHTAIEDMSLADAEFIAEFNPEAVLALLDRVETAEQALQRVRELHQPQPGEGERYCADCDQRWPCPTIKAIDSPQ